MRNGANCRRPRRSSPPSATPTPSTTRCSPATPPRSTTSPLDPGRRSRPAAPPAITSPRRWPTRAATGCWPSTTPAIRCCGSTARPGRRSTTTTPADWANSIAYAIGDRALRRRRRIPTGNAWSPTPAPAPESFAAAARRGADAVGDRHGDDGMTWITGPPGTPVENGGNLTYVCKYRNRFFFIEHQLDERLVPAAQCGRRRAAA